MCKKTIRYALVLLSLLMLCGAVLSMTACGQTWDWLWSRDLGESVNTGDMILGDGEVADETDVIFEGAVEYTGEAHSGTDIYYLGKEGSPNRSRIIVIDAGHQLKGSSALEPNGPGSEVMKAEVTWGATGVYTGQTEYELNLKVALLLRDELIRRGYSVVMIRETNNVSISNKERAEIANKYSAAAYVRIHANSWTDESMRGAMTICQSAANPYPTCAAHYQKSFRLTRLVLDEFCKQTGVEKMGLREMDDMTGTNWSEVPTTIVEMGFLSNKSEDSLMSTDYFRQEAAIGIANGLDRYFKWLETQKPEWETSIGQTPSGSKPAETEAPAGEYTEPSVDTPMEEPTEDLTEAPTESPTEVTEETEVTAEDPSEAASEPSAEVTEAEDPVEPEPTLEVDIPAEEPPADEPPTDTPAT